MDRAKGMVQQEEGKHALERGVYGNTNEAQKEFNYRQKTTTHG